MQSCLHLTRNTLQPPSSFVAPHGSGAQRTFRGKPRYPDHRTDEIAKALQRGEKYILSIQRKDGSWYGSWGVCFTYGAWFGCEALAALGHTYITCEQLRRACSFLLSKQRKDGGWGESYLSCQVCRCMNNMPCPETILSGPSASVARQ